MVAARTYRHSAHNGPLVPFQCLGSDVFDASLVISHEHLACFDERSLVLRVNLDLRHRRDRDGHPDASVDSRRFDLQRHDVQRNPLHDLAKRPFEDTATTHDQRRLLGKAAA